MPVGCAWRRHLSNGHVEVEGLKFFVCGATIGPVGKTLRILFARVGARFIRGCLALGDGTKGGRQQDSQHEHCRGEAPYYTRFHVRPLETGVSQAWVS